MIDQIYLSVIFPLIIALSTIFVVTFMLYFILSTLMEMVEKILRRGK